MCGHGAASLALLVALLAGCSAPPPGPAGAQPALAALERAAQANPSDAQARLSWVTERERTIARLLDTANRAVLDDRLDEALAAYRQARALDPRNERAAAGLAAIDAARRHHALVDDARTRAEQGERLGATLMLRAVLAEDPAHPAALALQREMSAGETAAGPAAAAVPALASRLQGPVSLEFRDAPLHTVMQALSRAAGINVLIDRDVPIDARVTVFVQQVRVLDAIDLILANHQLEKKVVSDNALFVYPATPPKLREHQALVIRTFQLGHAPAAQVQAMLRATIKTRDLFIDERSNTLVMRDKPEAVRAAERLITLQDRAEPEVMLEIEILEAARSVVREIGLSLPGEFAGPSGTLATIREIGRDTIAVDSGLALKMLREDGRTRTLASPRLRVRHREKARLHIGERVPVISSTVVGTAGGSGGSTPVTTEQIQYLDVGIKLDAEPTVHPDDTVAVRLNLDVSSLGTATRTRAGTVAYTVGTRNATTVLRLKDGETQALMGLIRDDDVRSGTGLPVLSEAPVLDRVFGKRRDEQRSVELVLLVTPRLVRTQLPPDAALAEFWSGTETSLRLRSPMVQSLSVADAQLAARLAGTDARAAQTALGAGVNPAALLVPAPAVLRWAVPPPAANPQEMRLALRVRALAPLKGTAVQMRFDPSELQVTGVDEGSFFSQGGRTIFSPRLDARNGVVHATLGSVEGPASGEGELLVLRLRARAGATRAVMQLSSGMVVDAEGASYPLLEGGAVELTLGR